MKKLTLLIIAGVCFGVSGFAQITFDPAIEQVPGSSGEEIDTSGEYVFGWNVGPGGEDVFVQTDAGEVVFYANPEEETPSGVTITGSITETKQIGTQSQTSEDFAIMMNSVGWTPGSTALIQINGLTVGQGYRVQLFSYFNNPSSRMQRFTDAQEPFTQLSETYQTSGVGNTGAAVPAKSIMARFVAPATSVSFNLEPSKPPTPCCLHTILNGIIIFKDDNANRAVPEEGYLWIYSADGDWDSTEKWIPAADLSHRPPDENDSAEIRSGTVFRSKPLYLGSGDGVQGLKSLKMKGGALEIASGEADFVIESTAPPLFFDDFESGAKGWKTSDVGESGTEWELGKPTNGPGEAHSSARAYGTGLTENYNDDTDVYLVSPVIDLTAEDNAMLEFWSYHDCEPPNTFGEFITDWCQVDILNEDGEFLLDDSLWIRAGEAKQWSLEKVKIPADALGQKIKLQFNFSSDGGQDNGPQAGWFIDSVAVTRPSPSEFVFERGLITARDVRIGDGILAGGGTAADEPSFGSVTITDGATLHSSQRIIVGNEPAQAGGRASEGTLTVNTGGSVIADEYLIVGWHSLPNTAVLKINGGSVAVSGDHKWGLSLGMATGIDQGEEVGHASFEMTAGTLITNRITNGDDDATGVIDDWIWTGGMIVADVINLPIPISNNGGTLSPGGLDQVGATVIEAKGAAIGDYVQNNGSLAIDVIDGEADLLQVSGKVVILGTLDLKVAGDDTGLSIGESLDVVVAKSITYDAKLITNPAGILWKDRGFTANVVNTGNQQILRLTVESLIVTEIVFEESTDIPAGSLGEEIDTTGRYVFGWNIGNTPEVDVTIDIDGMDVNFYENPQQATDSGVSISGNVTMLNEGIPSRTSTAGKFGTMLSSFGYRAGEKTKIEIDGLTVGQEYRIQIFSSFLPNPDIRKQRFTNSSFEPISDTYQTTGEGLEKSIIGRFVAQSSTVPFYAEPLAMHVILNGLVVFALGEPPMRLSVERADNDLLIPWNGRGLLQTSLEIIGPWTDIIDANSPYRVQPSEKQCFFRVIRN